MAEAIEAMHSGFISFTREQWETAAKALKAKREIGEPSDG